MDPVTTTATIERPEPDTETLPWWHSKANLGVLAIAIAVLCGALGWVIGNNRAIADPNGADIGFLQDMRVHHEQAVFMSLIYVAVPDTSPGLRVVANDIIVGQNIEIGRMIQLLRQFGAPDANESETAMAWMGEQTPADRMPGLATDADLRKLSESKGPEADQLFAALMITHHQGGIHMAEAAVDRADLAEVRGFATSMIQGQTSEIDEIRSLTTG
jgi:uncharacterized protein (DUF305 family)